MGRIDNQGHEKQIKKLQKEWDELIKKYTPSEIKITMLEKYLSKQVKGNGINYEVFWENLKIYFDAYGIHKNSWQQDIKKYLKLTIKIDELHSAKYPLR